MWRAALIVFLSLLATACATSVRSHITVFHEIDTGIAGTTYTLLPFKEQEGSLEHKSYEQIVRQELNAKGFKEVPLEQATVLVYISYGIDTGKQVAAPFTVGVGHGVGDSGTRSHTEYTCFLNLDIIYKTAAMEHKLRKFYEAKVIGSERGGHLAAVLPTMIKTLFEDFPGKSGSTRTVKRSID